MYASKDATGERRSRDEAPQFTGQGERMTGTTDSFVFYRSYFETIEQFENIEDKYNAYKILFEYAYYGKKPNLEECSLCERVALSLIHI